ncbi:MAG: aspartate/glutamate racemase family protein [Deltaproteobacteria bacterium]|nr:aspartate/glutamate racemase family protein [Deltaproteobacteria bacterium]
MRVIGLLGGMSWESTAEYYRLINQGVRCKMGGEHSAKIFLYSVDFAEISHLQHAGEWSKASMLLCQAAQSLEKGGADLIAICTNTMHKVADAVAASVARPLVNIVDATAEKIGSVGIKKVGLLGTRFTMEDGFYSARLSCFGLEVLTPELSDREVIHRVIYDELCQGKVRNESRAAFENIIGRMSQAGAQGVILGCTEIGLLVKARDSRGQPVLFDTTQIHAEKLVQLALEGS